MYLLARRTGLTARAGVATATGLALVVTAAPAGQGARATAESTYRAFMVAVADRDGAGACRLLTGPAAREFPSPGACARAYDGLASFFVPGALRDAIEAGADVSARGGRAQLTPRAACLGVALLRRSPRGWRIALPPVGPPPPAGDTVPFVTPVAS